MVTAIVIPIICIYFYWITKKEMKIKEQEWIKSGDVPEEALLSGRIETVHFEKQRYYYHRFVFIQEMKISKEGKMTTAKKTFPLMKNMIIDEFHQGQYVKLYGTWKQSTFLINRIEKIS